MSPSWIPRGGIGGGLPNTVFTTHGAPIEPLPRQVARNGLYPSARSASKLRDLTNSIARYRGKHVCSFTSAPLLPPGGPQWFDGDPARARWRCAYHSSPFATRLRVVLTSYRPHLHDNGTVDETPCPHFVNVYTMPLFATLVSSVSIPNAPPASTLFDFTMAPENWFYRYGVLEGIPPDTDLHIEIVESPKAETLAIGIYEEALDPDLVNSYLNPGVHIGTPILASDRSTVATILRNHWNRGASVIFNWSLIYSTTTFPAYHPRSTSSATPTNMVDEVSTSVTASSAGFGADLSNTLRLTDTGANVKVWVYGKNTVASNGLVSLQQFGGGTINVGPFGTSLGWVSATGQLVPNANKCDLLFSTASGTLTIEAVTVMLQD
jgi:hypothetical protein